MIQVLINNTEYTNNIPLPIKWNSLLDERLDEAVIAVHAVPVDLFPIGAPVNIQINADNSAAPIILDFIIASDQTTEIPPGSGKYDHELALIEPTKILEGIIVETLTFTNGLGRIYPAKFENVTVNTRYYDWNGEISSPPLATGIQPVSTVISAITSQKEPFLSTEEFTFPAWNAMFANRGYYISHGSVYIKAPNGTYLKSIFKSFDPPRPGARNTSIDATPLVADLTPGTYTAQYEIAIKERNTDEASWTSNEYYQATVSFDFNVVTSVPELPKWNIKTVINRVLDLAIPHAVGVSPMYILDATQAAEFEQISAPEFAFTNMTLKEILDQIGGYIHGIPRLIRGESGKLDTIHFDMLGGTNTAPLSDDKHPYVTQILSHNIENYATELDSTIENLVNTLDRGEGAITEPIAGGFRTTRCEEAYARITDGNMVIHTTEGIYAVHKLEIIDPINGKVGDISPYVFEGTDYGRLSSYKSEYPTSKAFALYYELGQPNIKGLNFKTPSVYPSTADYAITNIIKAVTGGDISAQWWTDKIDHGITTSGNYPTLKFRITYTPIFSARILQHKLLVEPNAFKRSLSYNQNANLVETRYYGENMKGAIARIGNAEILRTYHLALTELGFSLIPKAGQLWNEDYYVSTVTCALSADCIECTIGLSKDFNRLSQYIGINSEWRAYEVSEKNAYRRSYVYPDYVIIGDAAQKQNISASVTSFAVDAVKHCFIGASSNNSITGAFITTHAADGVDRKICLPVISTSFGNSLVFSCRFADNFSAGIMSEYGSNGKIAGYWQTDVEYCDFWGRFDSMRLELGAKAQAGALTEDFALAVPQVGGGFALSNSYISANLEIQKDNREIIQCNYALQFVSNWKGLIIGEAFMRNNEMVNASPKSAASLYVLEKPLGKFDNKVASNNTRVKISDLSNNDFVNLANGQGFSINRKMATAGGKAWAILDADGNIYLARNIDIEINDSIVMPTFSFVHELP